MICNLTEFKANTFQVLCWYIGNVFPHIDVRNCYTNPLWIGLQYLNQIDVIFRVSDTIKEVPVNGVAADLS